MWRSSGQVHCRVHPMWRTISIAYTSLLHKWCGGFPKEMFTNLTVETVIVVWGQRTVSPDTSTEYTQINERPHAVHWSVYMIQMNLSATHCHQNYLPSCALLVPKFLVCHFVWRRFVTKLELWEQFWFTPKTWRVICERLYHLWTSDL
jgi:hypothetical protein